MELNQHKELSWSCSVGQVCRARGYLWWREPDCLAHHRLLTDRVMGWRRSWLTVLRPGLPDWTPTNGDKATEPTGRSKSAHTEPWLEQIDLHITTVTWWRSRWTDRVTSGAVMNLKRLFDVEKRWILKKVKFWKSEFWRSEFWRSEFR